MSEPYNPGDIVAWINRNVGSTVHMVELIQPYGEDGAWWVSLFAPSYSTGNEDFIVPASQLGIVLFHS